MVSLIGISGKEASSIAHDSSSASCSNSKSKSKTYRLKQILSDASLPSRLDERKVTSRLVGV